MQSSGEECATFVSNKYQNSTGLPQGNSHQDCTDLLGLMIKISDWTLSLFPCYALAML